MIFRIGNTELKLSFSFVALVTLMIILCEESIVICSLVSSVVHECGHLFFMYISGDSPQNIELTLFGIRVDRTNKPNISYKKEFLISLGGIIFNAIAAIVSITLYNLFGFSDLLTFSAVNFIVASVNSFPVSVLDCGRAINSFLSIFNSKEKSELYADIISHIFVLLFFVITVAYFYVFGFNLSLFAVSMYLFFVTIIKKWS